MRLKWARLSHTGLIAHTHSSPTYYLHRLSNAIARGEGWDRGLGFAVVIGEKQKPEQTTAGKIPSSGKKIVCIVGGDSASGYHNIFLSKLPLLLITRMGGDSVARGWAKEVVGMRGNKSREGRPPPGTILGSRPSRGYLPVFRRNSR